jgi:acyl dehydratase
VTPTPYDVAVPAPYETVARNLATESENRIHADDVAQQLGFGGGLVPGVELFAYLTHPFVDAWGEDFLRSGALSARFRRPVYDGEKVTANATSSGDGYEAWLIGADGEVRAVGNASPAAPDAPLRQDYVAHPPRTQLLPVGPDELPLGPLGSIEHEVAVEAHDAYLDGIGETDGRYRRQGIVHPGALLRVVNDLLMQNVALGPWIHTSSACRFLGVAKVPGKLVCHGTVTECFERNGNSYVRYDALVVGDDGPVVEVDHTAIYRLGALST